MTSNDFQARVDAALNRWGMLPNGSRIGVAVSGGADSVALFRILLALAPERGWTLYVLHVNHKLRGAESDGDARFVSALAAEMGLFCEIGVVPVPADGNLEQAARTARYRWLRDCTTLHNLHKVALGHTRSDQAETVLFRFLRGSGAAGLAAIRPVTPDGFVRPLLDLSRDQVRAYLHNLAQPWREDSSNSDLSFDRNRLRLELLPNLAQSWNPAIERVLAHTAEWALAEEEYWTGLIGGLESKHLLVDAAPAVTFEAAAMTALPLAVSRRLIRRAIAIVRGDLHSIDFTHTAQVLDLCSPSVASGRTQIPGVDVMRSFEWIRLAPPGSYAGERHFRVSIDVPAEICLPECNSTLLLQVQPADYRYNESVNCLDCDRVGAPLALRTWLPGDQYRPVGLPSVLKLKTLFQRDRVPLWERRTWPVLVAGSEDAIVWTRQFGAAADCAVTSATRAKLRITERPSRNLPPASALLESEPDVRRL